MDAIHQQDIQSRNKYKLQDVCLYRYVNLSYLVVRLPNTTFLIMQAQFIYLSSDSINIKFILISLLKFITW